MKSTHLKLLPAWMPLTLLLACDPPSTTGTPAKDASQSALQVPILSVQEQVKWVDDSRQIISVTDDERAVIKYTMQENLRAIAQLLEAAAREDRTRVVKIAEAASVAGSAGDFLAGMGGNETLSLLSVASACPVSPPP